MPVMAIKVNLDFAYAQSIIINKKQNFEIVSSLFSCLSIFILFFLATLMLLKLYSEMRQSASLKSKLIIRLLEHFCSIIKIGLNEGK